MGKILGASLAIFGILMMSMGGLLSSQTFAIITSGNPIVYVYEETTTLTMYDFGARCTSVNQGWWTCSSTPWNIERDVKHTTTVNYVIKGAQILQFPASSGTPDITYDVVYETTGIKVGTVRLNVVRFGNGADLITTYTDFYGVTYTTKIHRVLCSDGICSYTDLFDDDRDVLPVQYPQSGSTNGYAPYPSYDRRVGFDNQPITFSPLIGIPDLVDLDNDGFHVGKDKDDNDKYVTTDSDEINKIRLYMISKELIEQLQNEAEILNNQINNLKSERDSLLNTIVSLSQDISTLNQQIGTIITQLKVLSGTLSGLVADIDIDLAQMQQTHDRISLISTETLAITEQTIPLADVLITTRQEDIASLTLGLDSSTNMITSLESVSFTGDAEEARVASLAFVVEINQTFTSQMEKAQLELGILLEIKNNLERQKLLQGELIAENIKLADEIIALQSKVKELNLTVEQQVTELNELGVLNERQSIMIAEQQGELERLKIKNAELDARYGALEENRKKIISEYEKLVSLLTGFDEIKAKFGGILSIIGFVSTLGGSIIFFKG